MSEAFLSKRGLQGTFTAITDSSLIRYNALAFSLRLLCSFAEGVFFLQEDSALYERHQILRLFPGVYIIKLGHGVSDATS